MADWLVNALSAPFNGENEEAYKALQVLDDGHEWGALAPGKGPRRVHPPQGAHSERRVPPRSLWYLGTCLQRFSPIDAEHAMWASRPANQDMETRVGSDDPWNAMYRAPDNLGTNPHLRSRKYTGYGIVMRAAVDTPEELSIHLQQIDLGPNYRWGIAGEGGCGVIYYFAAGEAYSYNGAEDVGDRDDQDTDFCTNFAVSRMASFDQSARMCLRDRSTTWVQGSLRRLVPRQEPGVFGSGVSKPQHFAGRQGLLCCVRCGIASGDRPPFFLVCTAGKPVSNHHSSARCNKGKESQRTEIETAATVGFWQDGLGDSMGRCKPSQRHRSKSRALWLQGQRAGS